MRSFFGWELLDMHIVPSIQMWGVGYRRVNGQYNSVRIGAFDPYRTGGDMIHCFYEDATDTLYVLIYNYTAEYCYLESYPNGKPGPAVYLLYQEHIEVLLGRVGLSSSTTSIARRMRELLEMLHG